MSRRIAHNLNLNLNLNPNLNLSQMSRRIAQQVLVAQAAHADAGGWSVGGDARGAGGWGCGGGKGRSGGMGLVKVGGRVHHACGRPEGGG